MVSNLQTLSRPPQKISDWPEKLKSPEDIDFLNGVLEALGQSGRIEAKRI